MLWDLVHLLIQRLIFAGDRKVLRKEECIFYTVQLVEWKSFLEYVVVVVVFNPGIPLSY